MHNHSQTYQVAIVGAGAVGLFLGICLEKAGISCIILEKRKKVRKGSRSLGIHPVSLELFSKLDITDPFLRKGIHISKGHAFSNSKKLGTLSFEDDQAPYNFILALPQDTTERTLQKELNTINPDILKRGAEVSSIAQDNEQATISYHYKGKAQTLCTDYVIGCDGKHSLVRQQMESSFEGYSYPDTYIMGDFEDNTDFGSDAAIFLCDEGLIESFPLPGQKRRWVVKTKEYISSPTQVDIEKRVQHRINHSLKNTAPTMLSSFGVQKMMATPMVNSRIILAGDAAHVVSPIGGQGMNLGWLGAWKLTQYLDCILNNNVADCSSLKDFEHRHAKTARNCMRRTELNMRLGRRATFPVARNLLVTLMLKKPISHLMAKLFTMRGVDRWII
ncbi:FAD-dependent oxidoreductase [Fodinibius halophilus]|uniref:FAD-dependent monooxygenase n=1 Tax=Fodinibius halophilus TaxID=1736908 RepID=A0A6M1TAF0_9BACT|nr:NAD(P)/FAD-dependent oxidoreductase [Fodinibius halophilus]NGP89011.1 FAD-dependent monooxygenase [Fodinibius halophilus]